MNFQKSVLVIAIILFLIIMLMIGVIIRSHDKNKLFPPEVPHCPDYWESMGQEGCRNTHGLGNIEKTECGGDVKFTEQKYQGESGRKNKCEWARNCEVEWDGITNVNLC